MAIYGIYCTANEKIYVGQTVNLRKRIRQHKRKLADGRHENIHMQRAYYKYGSRSFVCYLLERITDRSILTDRELYWVNALDSLNSGFNILSPIDSGNCGEGNPNSVIDENIATEIIDFLYQKKTNVEIAGMFDIPTEIVSSIRSRRAWTHIKPHIVNLPVSPSNYKLSRGDVARIKNLLSRSIKTQGEIAEEYNVRVATISKILYKHSWVNVASSIKMKPPVMYRDKPRAKLTEQDVIKIKVDLASNVLTHQQISDKYDISIGVVSGIKQGNYWADVGNNIDLSNREHMGHKLTNEDVITIKKMILDKVQKNQIAKQFNVSHSLITAIHRGMRHADIGNEIDLPKIKSKTTLNTETVIHIKKLLKMGYETWEVEQETGINRKKVWRIKAGKTWSNIEI